jgi:hypothetical protein
VQKFLDCYYPGKGFPSVSTTGRSCSLSCKHCAGRYLEGMAPVTEPDDLVEFASALADSGGSGFLLSGGCDAKGRVGLGRFAPAIRAIKATTGLKVNAHVGLAPRGELEMLFASGVDTFSVDVYGDDETIAEVIGIPAKATDYASVVRGLMDIGAHVAPHVCIGICGGVMGHERAAIDMMAPLAPEALVLISFIPTKGTGYASRRPPAGEDVVSLVSYARARLPRTRLLLGCMRSRRDRSWEIAAVRAGLDGIVLPSEETVRAVATLGYVVRKKETCCALG